MVWCVTLNPALDVTYRLSRPLTAGAINTATHMDGRLGGKGNNVARVVHQLGHPVTAVMVVGGHVGELLLSHADSLNIPVVYGNVPGESRICLTVVSDNGEVTEIRPPGPCVTKQVADALLTELLSLVEASDWITISGSLPPGLGEQTYADWVRALRGRVAGILVDTSGAALVRALAAGPTAITPNRSEFKAVAPYISPKQTHVLVTDGANGVAWYATEGRPRRWRAPKVKVLNPVGAGDAFLGTLASQLASGASWTDAIPFSVAAASASVESFGVATVEPQRIAILSDQVREVDLT